MDSADFQNLMKSFCRRYSLREVVFHDAGLKFLGTYTGRASEENITRNNGRIIFVIISFEWLLIKVQSLDLV